MNVLRVSVDQGIGSMWCEIQVLREWCNTSFSTVAVSVALHTLHLAAKEIIQMPG